MEKRRKKTTTEMVTKEMAFVYRFQMTSANYSIGITG